MLYSTKRKLHNLINGPGSAVRPAPTPIPEITPTAASAPATPKKDDRTKKRKTVDTPLSHRPSIRAVSPTGSIRSTVSTGSVLTRAAGNEKTPAYAPWDRAAFLERLKTFRFVDKWSVKPTPVNEVAWAKRGWVCVDKNRVKCGLCSKHVLVKLELDDDLDSESGNVIVPELRVSKEDALMGRRDTVKAMIENYENKIVHEHEEACLWKKRGCDDSIYHLALGNGAAARSSFASRYISLHRIQSEIPQSLSHPDCDLASIFFPSEATDDGPILESAAILAMFGWQNEDPSIPSLVTCSACFRRLGLWLFRKKTMSPIGDDPEVVEEASVCRLDVVGEHRDYCPWINAFSQGKEPGWQTLFNVMKQSPNGGLMSSAASVYSIQESPPREMTPAERDADDDSKLTKLKRLKSLYFGKKKKEKTPGKEKDGEADNGVSA
ncbi:hypothetical protein RUND412_001403 [Rhizina undulata]